MAAPGVDAALRWLLASPSGMPDHAVRRRARAMRLDPDHRRISDARLADLARRALRRRLPDGEVLLGLGELAARSHVDMEALVVRAMRTRHPRPACQDLLPSAKAVAWHRREADDDWLAVSLEQQLVSAALDQQLVDHADALVEHPWELRTTAYGPAFAIRIALALAPAPVSALLVAKPAGTTLALLQAATLPLHAEMVSRRDRDRLIAALIRSASPLLRVVGARALTGAGLNAVETGTVADAHRRLIDAGWSAADAQWIVAQRLKDAGHRLAGARRGLEQLEARLMPRSGRADANGMPPLGLPAVSPQQLDAARTRLMQAEAMVGAMVAQVAAFWPSNGLTEQQYARLQPCLVGGNGLRLDLAEALPIGASRDLVLDTALDDYSRLIGLDAPDAALEEWFFSPGPDVFAETRLAARAVLLRHDQDPKGPGRRTGLLIAPLSNAARHVISRPFARARNPRRYQSAVARQACALGFALEVAMAMPDARRGEAAKLAGLAMDHARLLLLDFPDDEFASPHVEQLACSAAFAMRDGVTSDKRAAWALDDALHPFARAVAAWSSPAFVAARPHVAEVIFAAAARPMIHMGHERFSWNIAVTLLDAAIAPHVGDLAAIAMIERLWIGAARLFLPYRCDPWPGEQLLAAARGDPEAIERVKADPGLRRTAVAQAV